MDGDFLLGPHSGLGFSLRHIFTTLIGINDILISFFSLFSPLSPLTLPRIYFSVWLIQPWDAPGIMGSQRGPSLELFSLVQDGSALLASLRHGIEQSIKVYLSICQLQWAVWWVLIGQAFLCFSSWLDYYSGCIGDSYLSNLEKEDNFNFYFNFLLPPKFDVNSCHWQNKCLCHAVCSLAECVILKYLPRGLHHCF